MPWYKVAMTAYLEAADPVAAQDLALALLDCGDDPDGPVASAAYPVELSPEQAESWRRLREILRRAKADAAAGLTVTSPHWPGINFSPAAAAELAALEFEDRQPELLRSAGEKRAIEDHSYLLPPAGYPISSLAVQTGLAHGLPGPQDGAGHGRARHQVAPVAAAPLFVVQFRGGLQQRLAFRAFHAGTVRPG